MSCREFTEFLDEYLFGTLPLEKRGVFEEHLARCPWCVAYLDSYKMTIQLERKALSAPEASSIPADTPEELIQAILDARSRAS